MSQTTFNNNQLSIDIKTQDILRAWFSQRGNFDGLKLKCISLGDSDIDYRMSTQQDRIKVLQAPFQSSKIKTRLLYVGNEGNLSGKLIMYLRRANENDEVESLYNYPPYTTFSVSVAPPSLANGLEFNAIPFDTGNALKEGFIAFIQTIPDGFFVNNQQYRFKETYDFVFNNVPGSWEVIPDSTNGSFLIAKPAGYVFQSLQGSIQITGKKSTISTTFVFNY